jgi:trigger factor
MPVNTKLTELSDTRVRIEAEVSSEEIESTLERHAQELGRVLKVPGFPKGRVPGPMVTQHKGRDWVLSRVVRDQLPRWYEEAMLQADVKPVGSPKLDLEELPEADQPFNFSIEVSITPKARLGTYKGLEVCRREPEVPAEAIDQELRWLRATLARVESVDRPLQLGDVAVVDFVGSVDGEPFSGGEARDYMLEIGGGRLVEGFDERLVGASEGESVTVEVDFPEDYHAEALRGKHATFAVEIKGVKEKVRPALDDDFATEASEFDSLEELRADIEAKLRQAQQGSIDQEFREAVVDAAAEAATIDLPDELVAARAEEIWERHELTLSHQNIDSKTYLDAAGKTFEQAIDDAKPDAARQLARESVLEAVAAAEQIEVSAEEAGADAVLRHDLRMRKAVDFLVQHATPIGMEKARARERR